MIISKEKYKKLVTYNKNLSEELHELERENKRLTLDNDTYYAGAIRWRSMYNKMRELFDNREIKSPIVKQRDAEIEALKHMLERLEAEQEKIRKENISLKEAVDKVHGKGTSELLKHQDKLIEENERQRQTISNMRDSYTRVQQREDYKAQLRNLQKDNDKVVEELSSCQQKLNFLRDMFETKLEVAEVYHDENGVAMWRQFLKEVE
jgi:Mg2+ and Co2+ transporters